MVIKIKRIFTSRDKPKLIYISRKAFMNIQTLLITLIFSLCCFSAEAGSAPASSSTVQGVVLGFNYEGGNKLIAYFEIDHSKEYIGKFNNVCAKKGRIWAFGLPNKFTCTKFEYIEEAGNGPVYALELSAKHKIKDLPHAITLSLKPLRPFKPDSRELELPEIQNLLSVYKSSSLKKVLQNAVKAGDVQILDIRKKSLSIYIIKWKHTGDEYSSNDYYYLVINRI